MNTDPIWIRIRIHNTLCNFTSFSYLEVVWNFRVDNHSFRFSPAELLLVAVVVVVVIPRPPDVIGRPPADSWSLAPPGGGKL